MTFTEFWACAFNVNNQNIYYNERSVRISIGGFYNIFCISDEQYQNSLRNLLLLFVMSGNSESLSSCRFKDIQGKKCLRDFYHFVTPISPSKAALGLNATPRKLNPLYHTLRNTG